MAAGLNACGAAKTPTPEVVTGSTGATGASPTMDEAALRKKIARMLIVGFRGDRVGPNDWIVKAISEQGLGGVILFDRDLLTGESRNINSPPQVTALIKSLAEAAPGKLIVSIDQEGGKIARLGPSNGFPATRSQEEIGAINSPAVTRGWAEGMAQTLVQIGVNFNFTPVVDLAVNPTNPAIALLDRAFSADPAVVVSCATDTIDAYRRAGVRTSIKHFPGLGSANGNTDFEAVDVTDTWTRAEIEPFQKLIQAGTVDTVMVTHFLNKHLDPDRPVSLSHAVVTDLLRGELGWQGVVVTDDMQAEAITSRYGRDEATQYALQAGVDQLVFCNQAVYDTAIVEQTVDKVLSMVKANQITVAQIDRSVARIDALWPPR
ncbi:glycosyl hydrolase [Rhizocola hellebori]|uniref:beta-N-acetylhexosaminidase n=1 Tax=Rhizocola hellebori TaxID=1392758 RepID=A0A8J3VLN9_9ACTN|nr:glycoside hydrolase family 3 N-terminal domain-containing protein [Rhizocola hellebori]GIH11589.1 glycosyl hydrolase [Rhizocola hellebori]